MAERPILFSGPMVRALLAGRKTVTRRLVLPVPTLGTSLMGQPCGAEEWWLRKGTRAVRLTGPGRVRDDELAALCPYGAPGDKLWVKETWRPEVAHSCGMNACACADVTVQYRADEDWRHFPEGDIPDAWCMPKAAKRGDVTPLFMPRWASRLTLEVVGVRAERLHDITEEDAKAEGLRAQIGGGLGPGPGFKWNGIGYEGATSGSFHVPDGDGRCRCVAREAGAARCAFRDLWCSINGAKSWDANPWVWRVEFTKREVPRG